MTFLNPAILFGLLAIGLPIAIHLLSKPPIRRVYWAAMQFLMGAIHKNRRRVQAEDLLLLLLRILLIALLVLVFSRPAFLIDATPGLGGLAAPAVILIDNSASMGQSNGTQSRFDQAKIAAEELLTKLAPGSASALYLVSDHLKAVIARPTQDMAILRKSIDQAQLADAGSDLCPGIKAAVDLLKSLSGTHREIFVFTDGQAAAFKQLGNLRELQSANKDIVVHFIILGEKGEDNVAVSGLQLSGTVAAVGQALRCVITVSNWGHAALQAVPVKLAADGQPPQDEGTIERIEPMGSKSITLVAHFREAGYHSLTASVPGDRLPSDNQRSTALLVIDQIRTLIVEGTINRDPVERDGFFLGHALVPVGPEQASRYYVSVETAQPDELNATNLSQYQLIFLSNVSQFTPRGAQNLRDYVTHGGGLVIFPGANTVADYYNSDPNFSTLLPAKLGPAMDAPGDKHFLAWQSKAYEHPLVTLWNRPESGDLANVRATRYFPLTLKTGATEGASAPAVVVKYTDGEPAVAEQSVGKGKVVLFSSTATTAWSTLPIHPAFVPLLSRIISFETSGLSGKLNLAPGESFAMPLASEYVGRDVSVLLPGQTKKRPAGEVESGDAAAFLRYRATDLAGAYQLFVGDEPRPLAVFAVQGDPEESNLSQLPKSDLDPLLNPGVAGGELESPGDPGAKTHVRVPGRELWIPLAIVALCLTLVETGAAHYFSQSK